jgi:hypothetical protein
MYAFVNYISTIVYWYLSVILFLRMLSGWFEVPCHGKIVILDSAAVPGPNSYIPRSSVDDNEECNSIFGYISIGYFLSSVLLQLKVTGF